MAVRPVTTSPRNLTRSAPPTARLLAAGATVVGAVLVVAGVYVPWMAYYAGLYKLSGDGTTNGARLLAAGGIGLVLAAAVALRGGIVSRWLVTGLGGAVVVFAAYLLVQLHTALSGADAMVVPQQGPGLYLVAGGGLMMFLTIFLPSSPRVTRDLPLTDSTSLPAHRQPLLSRVALRIPQATWCRKLQLGLGAVWLVDALLQCQPYMFSRSFATATLAPAHGDPAVVAAAVRAVAHLVAAHPAASNEMFALVQLAIALGLFWLPTVRVALAGSVLWGFSVWVLGEGLGHVFAASTTPFSGAPGAALLYVLLAVLLWPSRTERHTSGSSVAERSPLGRWGARGAWMALFALFVWETLPRGATASATAATLRAMATGEPAWLADFDRWGSSALGHHGDLVLLVACGIFAALGLGLPFIARFRREVILSAVAVAILLSVLQNFGGIVMGTATDISSAPLIVLLALSFWPSRPVHRLTYGATRPLLSWPTGGVPGDQQKTMADLAL
jgi:hypothetical protein